MSKPSIAAQVASSKSARSGIICFGDCNVSRQTHVLTRNGQPQQLRRKAFEVLLLLIDQRPLTLSNERIAMEVWGSKATAVRLVAGTIMDARRAIGDDPDKPRHIVSVRGVGYRFAGDVTHVNGCQAPEPELGQTAGRTARDDIDAAATRLQLGDFAEALRLVDRAIETADLAGARPEMARGMALGAIVLLRVDGPQRAMKFATKAVQIAQLDGRPEVIADTQLGMAEVQLWIGGAHTALDLLMTVYRSLVAEVPSPLLLRCESLLGQAYRQIGRLDEAWPWCERAVTSAWKLEPDNCAIRERLIQVSLLHFLLEMADADRRDDDVRTYALQILELLGPIETDARRLQAFAFEVVCKTYRAITLENLGRVQEGWAEIDFLRPLLFGDGVPNSPWMELRRKEFRYAEAGLLSRSNRHIEAVETIEAVIHSIRQTSDASMELASAQGLAAKLCQRARRYQDAIDWLRQQYRSVCRSHAERAQATASIVRAHLDSDRLLEELRQAQTNVDHLRTINEKLAREVGLMARSPLVDESGLVPAAVLAATVHARAIVARQRDLPLCVGYVEFIAANGSAEDATGTAALRRAKLLSHKLKSFIPDVSAVALWDGRLFLFICQDMGINAARQACQALAKKMTDDAVQLICADPSGTFAADAIDVTKFLDLASALAARPQPPGA